VIHQRVCRDKNRKYNDEGTKSRVPVTFSDFLAEYGTERSELHLDPEIGKLNLDENKCREYLYNMYALEAFTCKDKYEKYGGRTYEKGDILASILIRDYGEIRYIAYVACVAPGYGCGKALIKQVEEKGEKMGVRYMVLDSLDGEQASPKGTRDLIKFYLNLGYEGNLSSEENDFYNRTQLLFNEMGNPLTFRMVKYLKDPVFKNL